MRVFSFTIVILFISILVPFVAFGQSSLKGTVIDATTNEALIGVNIIIQGTSLGAATDIEGQYKVVGIPEHVVNIIVSCIGYEAQTIEIDFSQAKEVQKNIQMKPQVIEGEEVVITAQMRGQLAAINQQITANRIVNVVSEEKIQELPDANAAEAIGRLPGVSIIRSGGEASGVVLRGLSSKYSNITIDGVKIPPTDPNSRDVDLSVLSQGALAGIELYKTLSPDQDADAIAGGINMVTRKAPSGRLVRIDVKGTYNQLMKTGKQYDLGLRYSERFFDDLLGFQIQGNKERKIRSQENISYGYTTTDNATLPSYGTYDINAFDNDYYISRFTVRFTDEVRTRNNMQAIFDYNTPDSGSVKLSGIYAQTNRNYMIYERVYSTWHYDFEHIIEDISTLSGSLQGRNYLFGMTIDWNGSFAESQIKNPKDFSTMFSEGSGSTGSVGAIKDHPEKFMTIAANNFQGAVLDSMTIYKTENYDKEQTAQLNISRSVTLFDMFTNEIKIGAKYKAKARRLNNFAYTWNTYPSTGNFSNVDFSGTRFSGKLSNFVLSDFMDINHVATRDLFGLYTMTPLIDVSSYDLFNSLTNHATLSWASNYGILGMFPAANYFVTERVAAAYVMDNIDLGQTIKLLIGVRVEQEENDYKARYIKASIAGTGNVITVADSLIIDTTASYTNTMWLPNAQLCIKPTDYLTVRLAAYKALARPDFSVRLPQFAYSVASSSTANIVVGNPQLKTASAWNFEANTQVYNNTIGLITVSGYYKRIDNMVHYLNGANVDWEDIENKRMGWYKRTTNYDAYHRLDNLLGITDLEQWKSNRTFNNILHQYTRFTITTAYNSSSPSYAWGFELEHQLNFHFLPISWLQNFTLNYNLTIARSKTTILLQKSLIDTLFNPAQTFPRRDSSYTLMSHNTIISQTKPMEDQPQLFGNISLGYDIGDFSARISMFYQSRYTRTYSADGTSDGIVGEFIKWDISLKQQITPVVSLMLNIDNIFNKRETRYRYNNKFDWGYIPTSASLYGTTIDLGARVTL